MLKVCWFWVSFLTRISKFTVRGSHHCLIANLMPKIDSLQTIIIVANLVKSIDWVSAFWLLDSMFAFSTHTSILIADHACFDLPLSSVIRHNQVHECNMPVHETACACHHWSPFQSVGLMRCKLLTWLKSDSSFVNTDSVFVSPCFRVTEQNAQSVLWFLGNSWPKVVTQRCDQCMQVAWTVSADRHRPSAVIFYKRSDQTVSKGWGWSGRLTL